MIETTLPYDIEKLNDIRETGAHVRIAGSDFSKYTDQDNMFTTMVYLRNTNFTKVELDFSDVPYDQKERMMQIYMKEDMKIDNHEFADAVYDIFLMSIGEAHALSNEIFDDQDTRRFVENNKEYIRECQIFIKSLSLFILSRLKCLENDMVNDICMTDAEPCIGSNILNIIRNDKFDRLSILLASDEDIPLRFFSKTFTIENNELFDALRKTTYGFLVEAITQEATNHVQ